MSRVKLGDVAIESRETNKGDKSGLPIVGLEHITPEEVTLSTWATDTENTFTKMFRKGDMLFGRRRAYLKKATQAPFDGICSGDITVIRAKTDKLLPDLLPFIIQNDDLFDFAVGKSAGSLSPRVKWENLKNYLFELPSLDEQKKLAEVLWSINDTLQAYQKLVSETDELVKSQFIEMFGDPIKNELLWPKKQLQELVSADCSISYGVVKTGDDVPGGVPVFRPIDIVGKVPSINNLKRTTPEISTQYKRTLLTGRELLITVRANIGDTCIIDEEFKDCNVGRGIVPIRLDESVMRLEFLKGQMDFDSVAQHIKSLAKGVTLIQLNMEDLRLIEFIVPPVELQDQYIGFLKQVDKSKFTLQSAISTAQSTKCSLIAEALGLGRKE
jgi:type I restriction enzyme S subunit